MTPQHVAPLAVFLCSDAGSDVSGEVLGVAGGRVYALRSRETTGAFAEQQGFTPDGIRNAWGEITRG
jgi:NAD(P)-dependent dehydrogenase (short-subunit alcohol dehydrogenase family)